MADGISFYESQQPGLGGYFFACLSSDIDSLALHGGVHRKLHGAHRALSRVFPFAIYYDVIDDSAHVKAVLDCRRDPKWIRQKLK